MQSFYNHTYLKTIMYKHFLRPILFLLSPESIHHLIVFGLKIFRWVPGFTALLRALFTVRHPSLEREVFGLKFSNPIGLAAGFDKNAECYNEIAAFGFGAIETGTVTPKGQPGNAKPRCFRLPKDRALINRMGFNNRGADAMLKCLKKKKRRAVIGVNLGKNTATPNEQAPAEYLSSFRKLYDYADYFVINVSCPNIKNLCGLQDKDNLEKIIGGLTEFRRGQSVYRPILMKISPDLTDSQIDDTIDVLRTSGIDGIVATNTTTSREGLKTDAKTVEAIANGGLSGGPLTARAIEVVRYVHRKTEGNFPIIGVGGIMSVDDAVAMLDAGASLIQLYTGFIYNGPGFAKQICKRLIKTA
ncbi:quinone-dependent dihydroorotate dehydrogenase [Alistipes sp. OttesenSCG-928-L06]|nr:quinone-dependent dihydroorotate dehydrogenase [Alistipes sp. OttesenSCG-928-L06]